MPLRTRFQFIESRTKILEPITKFGGQPVWINRPYWPIEYETDEKMLFLGQIELNRQLFPGSNGEMVYIFFGEASEPLSDRSVGIVIQTSESIHTNEDDELQFVSETTGPAIYELGKNDRLVYKEYQVLLEALEEEESIPLEKRFTIYDYDDESGFQFSKPSLAGNKIGGQPLYIEGLDDPPEEFNSEQWLLLLQLAPLQGYWNNSQPNFYPFYMNLGDLCIMTIFISKDYKLTKCFIQQG